jgi:hypothetical protein
MTAWVQLRKFLRDLKSLVSEWLDILIIGFLLAANTWVVSTFLQRFGNGGWAVVQSIAADVAIVRLSWYVQKYSKAEWFRWLSALFGVFLFTGCQWALAWGHYHVAASAQPGWMQLVMAGILPVQAAMLGWMLGIRDTRRPHGKQPAAQDEEAQFNLPQWIGEKLGKKT